MAFCVHHSDVLLTPDWVGPLTAGEPAHPTPLLSWFAFQKLEMHISTTSKLLQWLREGPGDVSKPRQEVTMSRFNLEKCGRCIWG